MVTLATLTRGTLVKKSLGYRMPFFGVQGSCVGMLNLSVVLEDSARGVLDRDA